MSLFKGLSDNYNYFLYLLNWWIFVFTPLNKPSLLRLHQVVTTVYDYSPNFHPVLQVFAHFFTRSFLTVWSIEVISSLHLNDFRAIKSEDSVGTGGTVTVTVVVGGMCMLSVLNREMMHTIVSSATYKFSYAAKYVLLYIFIYICVYVSFFLKGISGRFYIFVSHFGVMFLHILLFTV